MRFGLLRPGLARWHPNHSLLNRGIKSDIDHANQVRETTMLIYVGNIADRVTEDQLRELFEEVGQVTSCTIIRDSITRKSKGFGFIEMPDASEARAAINGLNGKELFGRKLDVNEARHRPKSESE
jgi:RNA recognition motif-containing protein